MNNAGIEEIYSKIGELRITVVNAKGLTGEKEERIGKCIRSMLDIMDLPDMWYSVRRRVVGAAILLLICVVVSEIFLLAFVNNELVVLVFGAVCFSALAWLSMSFDKVTEKIIRSGNRTLHRIFVLQISQNE